MSAIARQTRAYPRAQIDPIRLVEAGVRHIASRSQIRSLLAQFLTEHGAVERFEMSETAIPVTEADLLWWSTQTPPAAIDDEQYPGD
jgi:hypothetical protein